MKKIIALLLGLLLCFGFTACSGNSEEDTEVETENFSYENLDLAKIADDIYENIEISELTAKSVSKVTNLTTLTEQYYLDISKILAFEVRSAEGQFGVADVILLRAKKGYGDEIAEAIEHRKDDRINEFLKYDVYNSYAVALEAEIYQEGEIVVMLMLSEEDKAIAKEIIDGYLYA